MLDIGSGIGNKAQLFWKLWIGKDRVREKGRDGNRKKIPRTRVGRVSSDIIGTNIG